MASEGCRDTGYTGAGNLSESALEEPRRTGELAARYPIRCATARSSRRFLCFRQPALATARPSVRPVAVSEAPARVRAAPSLPAEVSVHEPRWESLVQDFSVGGASHSGGVHLRGYPQSYRAKSARRARISLVAGDLYIFHSNRLHEVHEVPRGERERVTLAVSAGLGESDLALWA